jgi:hypothetical protein
MSGLVFVLPLAAAEWLADAKRIEQQLSLVIRPVIDFIQSADKKEEGDDEEITKLLAVSKISPSLSPANSSIDSPKREREPLLYRIKPDWQFVLTHPTFGEEYRNYIRTSSFIRS